MKTPVNLLRTTAIAALALSSLGSTPASAGSTAKSTSCTFQVNYCAGELQASSGYVNMSFLQVPEGMNDAGEVFAVEVTSPPSTTSLPPLTQANVLYWINLAILEHYWSLASCPASTILTFVPKTSLCSTSVGGKMTAFSGAWPISSTTDTLNNTGGYTPGPIPNP
jgi:hypothetical protein